MDEREWGQNKHTLRLTYLMNLIRIQMESMEAVLSKHSPEIHKEFVDTFNEKLGADQYVSGLKEEMENAKAIDLMLMRKKMGMSDPGVS